jgi:hypothetical protein
VVVIPTSPIQLPIATPIYLPPSVRVPTSSSVRVPINPDMPTVSTIAIQPSAPVSPMTPFITPIYPAVPSPTFSALAPVVLPLMPPLTSRSANIPMDDNPYHDSMSTTTDPDSIQDGSSPVRPIPVLSAKSNTASSVATGSPVSSFLSSSSSSSSFDKIPSLLKSLDYSNLYERFAIHNINTNNNHIKNNHNSNDENVIKQVARNKKGD